MFVEDEVIDRTRLPLASRLSQQTDASGAECVGSIFDYHNGYPSVDLDDLHFDSANTGNAFEEDCLTSYGASLSVNCEDQDRTNASECSLSATIIPEELQPAVSELDGSNVARVADELADCRLSPHCVQTVADSKAQNTRQPSRLPGPRSRVVVGGNDAQANRLTAVECRNSAV